MQQPFRQIEQKFRDFYAAGWVPVWRPGLQTGWKNKVMAHVAHETSETRTQLHYLHVAVKEIGISGITDEYEKRKLGIFNQINFFQLLIGICMPVAGMLNAIHFPPWTWLVATLPSIISLTVLFLNARKNYDAAILVYFIAYPVITSFVYMSGINLGVELFFILYGILSVFFLQQLSHMLFSIGLSMISYFVLAVLWSDHHFQLGTENMLLYLFNEVTGIVFIFYGLFLIKKENLGYQSSVLTKNKEIAANSVLLEKQTIELTDLNNVKNKLFSVIAHDLRTPMYSLRTLFSSMQKQSIPAKQIRAMLPDVINNLNYTTGLMENLLQWAKSQMQSQTMQVELLDVSAVISETTQLLSLQASVKQLTLNAPATGAIMVYADKDMIALVVRNLISNAIKFTPEKGHIAIGIKLLSASVEIAVIDSGRGISSEAVQKINQRVFFSTNGTAQEPGTGLGLMLCQEFLQKNNSQLTIESTPGKGSTFSFTLPLAEQKIK